MNVSKNLLISLLVLSVIWGQLLAGTTGKISGRVTDKASGEMLPGVNVILENTVIGASTDADGLYFILQIPPGTYTVRFIMVGYQELRVENVQVSVDHTTRLDAALEERVEELDEAIVVRAERPVIQKDMTSSTQFIEAQQLRQLPVTDARDGILLQTGVFFDPIPVMGGLGSAGRGEPRYSVRGGGQDEVKWYIDGVRTAALVAGRADWGGSFSSVNLNAIEEAQVITGGFNAEYGEAQSGIVNIVTKEGGERLSGSVEYIYSPPGQRHFGNYLYDRETQKEFIDNTLEDGTLDPNWWTPYRRNQIYDYRTLPDYTIYLSLGGPLFRINQKPLKFFISSQIKEEAYTLPHPRKTRGLENVMFNLSHFFKPNMKLRLAGTYNHEYHSTLQENGDFTNQAKYYRGWGSLLDTYTYNGSLQLSHTVNAGIFYDLKLSYFLVDFKEKPGGLTVLGESDNPTLWGFHRYDGFEDEPFDQYAPVIKNHTQTGDISLIGNLSWQLDKENLLKTGFEARYITFAEKGAWRYPSYTTEPKYWINRGLHETYNPLQFAAYLQDKMEFESMILNIGLRYDYFNPNRDWFDRTPLFNLAYDPDYDVSLDPDLDQVDANGNVKFSFDNVLDKERSPARSYHMFSPRVGVSFPVTEKTLLHFNYGHFYQMPPLDQMFEFFYFRPVYIVDKMIEEDQLAAEESRDPYHIPSIDGDPERVVAYTAEPLKPQKTIQFEVGVEQNLFDFARIDITAFYKDVFDQTEERVGLFDRFIYGYDPRIDTITTNLAYAAFLPGDYGDSRGFEITFKTLYNKWYGIDLNYTFSRAIQGRASPRRVNLNKNGAVSYVWDSQVEKRIPVEKTYSRPHIMRANLFLNYPDFWAERFPLNLFKETSASIMYRYVSGQAFTYKQPDDPPDTYNNYRYPASQRVDLKIDKSFTIFDRHQLSFYVRITNLFNRKNVRSIGDIFFDAEVFKNYVENGEISTVDGAGYDISWQTWYEPRRFYFGAKYVLN